MALQPFSRAANIDKLHRAACSEVAAYIYTPMDRYADKPDSMLSPLLLVCEGISDYIRKADPCQTALRLFCAICILGNQEEFLHWVDQDCCPACEGSHEAQLHRSRNMKRGKLFRFPGIQNQSASALFLLKLSRR